MPLHHVFIFYNIRKTISLPDRKKYQSYYKTAIALFLEYLISGNVFVIVKIAIKGIFTMVIITIRPYRYD